MIAIRSTSEGFFFEVLLQAAWVINKQISAHVNGLPVRQNLLQFIV